MRLQRVEIQDLGGLEYLAFDTAGSLIEVTGANGAGKTSVLNSLRAIAEGGHDPSLIRLGAKKGTVKLLLDDGTTIVRTITEKASRTEITTRDGQIIPAPQSFVAELMSGFAFDPTALITATPKERTAYLLSAMPISVTAADIEAAGAEHRMIPSDGIDLDGLATIRDGVFNTRKLLNKSVRDSEGTIASLRQGMPAEDGTDWTARWKELEVEAADVEVQIREAEKDATNEFIRIANELKEDRDKAIRLAEQTYETATNAARNERDQKLKHVADVAKPERERLATEKAQAWERSQAQGKATGARQTIEAMHAKVRADSVESERLTRVLEALEALRRRKLDELPIPGVELRDGEVFVGGVAFEQLNTAQQFALSIRLAKLKLGRLPLLVVDHGECFDAETWDAFRESAKESGLQLVVARVSNDSALKVVTS